jgi:shikimate dehydrogenase
MKVDQHTKLYGVVGYPIGHSMSPVMQNAAFSAKGLNAVYLAFETKDIEGCLKGMKTLGISGMSVTIPHKSALISLLDDVDALAMKIGAVNTIINTGGRLVGYNTDAIGALKALEEKIDLTGKSCLLIGAGGAARAIGFGLKEKGVTISVANRSSDRGRELAALLDSPYMPLKNVGDNKADLLIQTTPVGMYPHVDRCPIHEHVLKGGMVVMDIIYNPIETRLLKMARRRGCRTIDGLSMFIHQGAEQFRLWTGLDAPISDMAHALKAALGKRN